MCEHYRKKHQNQALGFRTLKFSRLVDTYGDISVGNDRVIEQSHLERKWLRLDTLPSWDAEHKGRFACVASFWGDRPFQSASCSLTTSLAYCQHTGGLDFHPFCVPEKFRRLLATSAPAFDNPSSARSFRTRRISWGWFKRSSWPARVRRVFAVLYIQIKTSWTLDHRTPRNCTKSVLSWILMMQVWSFRLLPREKTLVITAVESDREMNSNLTTSLAMRSSD